MVKYLYSNHELSCSLNDFVHQEEPSKHTAPIYVSSATYGDYAARDLHQFQKEAPKLDDAENRKVSRRFLWTGRSDKLREEKLDEPALQTHGQGR